jgi:hypothetical protein
MFQMSLLTATYMQIPAVMYLLTHAYFCLYHALSNLVIRRTLHATKLWGLIGSRIAAGAVIFVLAYITAFMETFTISQVRADRDRCPSGTRI